MDSKGTLVNSSGYALSPAMIIPSDAQSVNVASDGTVQVFVASSSTPTSLGQLQLARFSNPSGLTSQGQNLYSDTPASGTPTTGIAGQDGFGTIGQGMLEGSNVQMVTELVNLITAQRAYETNSKAIQAGDQMLTTANQLITA